MSLSYWQHKAAELKPEGRAFIDGRYCEAASGETFPCYSPIDGRLLTSIASCDADDANLAVACARRAFDSGIWSQIDPAQRKGVLLRFAQLIEQHTEELALFETLDMGKPISDSLTLDVPGSAECVAWTAEAIDKLYGEIAPVPANQVGLITREAAGVVAAIVPWNFPLQMACWKIAPALAMGNSVILKPSEKSPLTATGSRIKLLGRADRPGDGIHRQLQFLENRQHPRRRSHAASIAPQQRIFEKITQLTQRNAHSRLPHEVFFQRPRSGSFRTSEPRKSPAGSYRCCADRNDSQVPFHRVFNQAPSWDFTES